MQTADLHFWRDNVGHEVDLLFEAGDKLQAVEIKSGATFSSDWLDALGKWQSLAGADALPPWVVYGGDEGYQRNGAKVFGWMIWPVVNLCEFGEKAKLTRRSVLTWWMRFAYPPYIARSRAS